MNGEVNLQPTLIGARVIVRPVVAADWTGMFAAAADPKIWEVHPESDRYQEAVFRTYFDGALACKSAFTFVETVVFWVGETNIRSRRAMEKIGAALRPGVQHRDIAGEDPYVVYEIRSVS